MKALRRGFAAALFVGVTLATSLAWGADTKVGDPKEAERLFQRGLDAMKKNDYPVACDAFLQSNNKDPSPGTQINLAICYEKQKKWASAWVWYSNAAGLAHDRGQKPREDSASESARALEPKLHYLVVSIKNPTPDTEVKRDGEVVVVQLAGKDEPMKIDPGEHTIEVKAPGKKTVTKKVTTEDNAKTDTVDITLEAAEVDPNAPPPNKGGGPIIIREEESNPLRTVGVIVGIAGLCAEATALGVFIFAKSQASQRDDLHARATDPNPANSADQVAAARSYKTYNDAATSDQLVAQVVAGAGLGLLAAGVALFIVGAPTKKEKTAGVHITPSPTVAPGYQAMGLTGTF